MDEHLKTKLVAALAVMILDPKIHDFLETNDPKALEQAQEALKAAGFTAGGLSLEPFRGSL